MTPMQLTPISHFNTHVRHLHIALFKTSDHHKCIISDSWWVNLSAKWQT